MVDFSMKLKELRTQARMTQKELAERLGVTKSVVSYYELSERNPSPEVLIKLARIFHVTTDYLLGIEARTEGSLDVSGLSDADIELLQHTIDTLKRKK